MAHVLYWILVGVAVMGVGFLLGLVITPVWVAAVLSFTFGVVAGGVATVYDPFLK